jgi:hypothetical protein
MRHNKPPNTKAGGMKPMAGKVRCCGCGYALAQTYTGNSAYYCKQHRLTSSDSCLQVRVETGIVYEAAMGAVQKLFEAFGAKEAKRKESNSRRAISLEKPLNGIEDLELQIAAAQNEKLELYIRYGDNEISKGEYMRLRDEADCGLAAMSARHEGMESDRRQDGAACGNSFAEAIGTLRFDGQLTREIADALIDKVVVFGPGKIEIKWRFKDIFVGDGCASD